ncbi:MAG: hypothetical protein OEM91_06805, partial [Hyphomicrobiales bacterium]|nr:hypothetical protein [Hyphomicrobiales bacterium]
KCSRWTRQWDYRRGRYRSRCIRYRTVRSTRVTATKMTKDERAVIRFAAKYVRSRAKDSQLSAKQHHGWVSQRVATDLRGFLKQDKHPAICSGAVEMADYFTGRMDDVSKRAGIFEENSKKAHSLAAAKIAEIRDVVKAEPGGHPGWGPAPLSMTLAGSDRTLRDLVGDVAELAGEDAPVTQIRQSDDAFAALKTMREYTSGGGLKPLTADARSAILHALSLLEAADYISSVHDRYLELDHSIIGSLTAMKKAHGEHCTCGR